MKNIVMFMNKKVLLEEYTIEKLNKNHNLNDFYCKYDSLNRFLKHNAYEEQKNNFNVTYLAIYDDIIVGYFSLLTDYIQLKKVNFPKEKSFENAPAIKIGRLAIDKKYERKGLGTSLLDVINNQIKDISNNVGIKYITVDAYVSARIFYENNEFEYILNIDKEKIKKAEKRDPTSSIVMYKDIKKL